MSEAARELEFGLGVLGYHGCWDDVAFAERHGFATAGFVDSPLLGGETFAGMALAAAATERIRVGPFLAVPGNRRAAITAQGVATINRLAAGRARRCRLRNFSIWAPPPLTREVVTEVHEQVMPLLRAG